MSCGRHHPAIHGGELCASYTYGLCSPFSPEQNRRENWWYYSQSGPGIYQGDLLYGAAPAIMRQIKNDSVRILVFDLVECVRIIVRSAAKIGSARDVRTGALTSIGKVEAGKTVMPMAVAPERGFAGGRDDSIAGDRNAQAGARCQVRDRAIHRWRTHGSIAARRIHPYQL
jgi:hypothetical protein